MKSYYIRAKQLKQEIKEMQEMQKNAQKELEEINVAIAAYEKLPASSGGKVKVRIKLTKKYEGQEPEVEEMIDFVDYEIYVTSQDKDAIAATMLPQCLCRCIGLEFATITMELIQE